MWVICQKKKEDCHQNLKQDSPIPAAHPLLLQSRIAQSRWSLSDWRCHIMVIVHFKSPSIPSLLGGWGLPCKVSLALFSCLKTWAAAEVVAVFWGASAVEGTVFSIGVTTAKEGETLLVVKSKWRRRSRSIKGHQGWWESWWHRCEASQIWVESKKWCQPSKS